MAVREVITDAKGNRVLKPLKGFADTPKPKEFPKEEQMRTNGHKKATKAVKRIIVKKSPFSATVMALNSHKQYVKKSQVELEDDKKLIETFGRWVRSGQVGEFYASRRG